VLALIGNKKKVKYTSFDSSKTLAVEEKWKHRWFLRLSVPCGALGSKICPQTVEQAYRAGSKRIVGVGHEDSHFSRPCLSSTRTRKKKMGSGYLRLDDPAEIPS